MARFTKTNLATAAVAMLPLAAGYTGKLHSTQKCADFLKSEKTEWGAGTLTGEWNSMANGGNFNGANGDPSDGKAESTMRNNNTQKDTNHDEYYHATGASGDGVNQDAAGNYADGPERCYPIPALQKAYLANTGTDYQKYKVLIDDQRNYDGKTQYQWLFPHKWRSHGDAQPSFIEQTYRTNSDGGQLSDNAMRPPLDVRRNDRPRPYLQAGTADAVGCTCKTSHVMAITDAHKQATGGNMAAAAKAAAEEVHAKCLAAVDAGTSHYSSSTLEIEAGTHPDVENYAREIVSKFCWANDCSMVSGADTSTNPQGNRQWTVQLGILTYLTRSALT
jgi:hypothetical protein